jgi:hypothetical protein
LINVTNGIKIPKSKGEEKENGDSNGHGDKDSDSNGTKGHGTAAAGGAAAGGATANGDAVGGSKETNAEKAKTPVVEHFAQSPGVAAWITKWGWEKIHLCQMISHGLYLGYTEEENRDCEKVRNEAAKQESWRFRERGQWTW